MADGTLKVGTITTSSGSGTITLGQSGETVDMANGTITLNSSMKNTPAFLGLRSTTQSLAASSTVTITYDSEDVDTDSAFNIATGIFTVPSGKEGTYLFVATITSAADMGAGEILSLNLNGSDSNDEWGLRIDTLNSRVVGTVSGMKYMNVGDTMKFEVDNGTNGSTSNIAYAKFGGFKLT